MIRSIIAGSVGVGGIHGWSGINSAQPFRSLFRTSHIFQGVWAPVHTPPCIKDCLTLGIWEAPMSIKPSKPLADAFMERGPVGVSE